MTRAAEFCYIAEQGYGAPPDVPGKFVMGWMPTIKGDPMMFTDDPELALRLTHEGRLWMGRKFGSGFGFRKVLAG